MEAMIFNIWHNRNIEATNEYRGFKNLETSDETWMVQNETWKTSNEILMLQNEMWRPQNEILSPQKK